MNLRTSKTKMIILSFFFVLFMHTNSNSAQHVNIAISIFPPYVHHLHELNGFMPEIITAAFESQGYEVSFHHMSFSRALTAVRDGEYDAIAPIYWTRERENFLLFSESVGKSRTVLLNPADEDIVFKSLIDLKNYRIGVIRGAKASPDFDNATYLKKEEVSRYEQNIKKLLAGRIDLVVGNELVLIWTINELCRKTNQCLEYVCKEMAINSEHIGFPIKNNNNIELAKAFNRGLSIIKENNILDLILQKYDIALKDGLLRTYFQNE